MPLKYIGKGKSILGLPARDLSDDDIESYSQAIGMSNKGTVSILIERGLYKALPKQKTTKVKDSD